METADLTTATPAEIDAQLFPLWAERWTQAEYAREYRHQIAATVWKDAYTNRYGVAAARRGINLSQLNDWNKYLHKTEAKLAEIQAQIDPIDAEFERRGGWTRYVLVKNTNGHLHYRSCSTFRIGTQLLLIDQASGMDSGQVVEAYDNVACTKCFPEAPVAKAVIDPNTCTGAIVPGTSVYVNRYYNGGTFGQCDGCGQTVKVKQDGSPFKHKAKAA